MPICKMVLVCEDSCYLAIQGHSKTPRLDVEEHAVKTRHVTSANERLFEAPNFSFASFLFGFPHTALYGTFGASKILRELNEG